MKEAGYDKDKRLAVFDETAPAEIPALLAELQARSGMHGLDPTDQQLAEEMVAAWHAKAPDAALACTSASKSATGIMVTGL